MSYISQDKITPAVGKIYFFLVFYLKAGLKKSTVGFWGQRGPNVCMLVFCDCSRMYSQTAVCMPGALD